MYVDRFSNRVEDYAKYRPSYPDALIDLLRSHGLGAHSTVLDAGSGTGLLTEKLIAAEAGVYALEPNAPMREEAERRLGHHAGFRSLAGSAERTGLPDASVDMITAAQSFHWFDLEATKPEWLRILRAGGWVVLIWNERNKENPVCRAYGEIADRFVLDQGSATRRLVSPEAQIEEFFAPMPVTRHTLPNLQLLDRDGLIGRALSSSYWPKEGPEFEESMSALNAIFDQHQVEGRVVFDYVTELFLGQLDSD